MPVILGPKWWWNYFKKLFGLKDFTRGGITLSSGWHEIFIPTACTPAKVRLRVLDVNMPCCGGEICLTASCILPDGFILYADVKTDACEVEWIIEYEDHCPTPPDIFGSA